MSKEKRFVIQVDPLEIEDDAIFDNKELRLYECQSDMMSDICSLLNKQDQRIADLEAKLAEEKEYTQQYRKECAKIQTDYYELKEQLAEKEEELKYYETLLKRQCNECKDQDKISFAVEQLDKVKEFCNNPKNRVEYKYCPNAWTYAVDKDKLMLEIDNQINELKGNVEDVKD